MGPWRRGFPFFPRPHRTSVRKRDLRVAWEEPGLLRSGSYIVADNVLVPGARLSTGCLVRSRRGLLQSRPVKGLIMAGRERGKCDCVSIQRGDPVYLFELSIGIGDHHGPSERVAEEENKEDCRLISR